MSAIVSGLAWLGLAAPGGRQAGRVPAAPVAAQPGARPAAPASPAAPWPLRGLRLLGLAEAPVRIAGHPRIRERRLTALARRRRRHQLVTASVGAVLVLLLLGTGLVRSPLMAVEAVSVVGVGPAQRDAVTAVLGVSAGTNVLDIDLAVVRDRVESLPWVAAAGVTRRLPSTVEVRVATRTPVVTAVLGSERWLLDADGLVIEHLPAAGGASVAAAGDVLATLPTVSVLRAPAVGERIADPAISTIAAVARDMPRALDELVVAYAEGVAGEVDATLLIPTADGDTEVVAHLGRPDGIRAKAASIAALVEEVRTHGVPARSFDVRIPDRPVIRT